MGVVIFSTYFFWQRWTIANLLPVGWQNHAKTNEMWRVETIKCLLSVSMTNVQRMTGVAHARAPAVQSEETCCFYDSIFAMWERATYFCCRDGNVGLEGGERRLGQVEWLNIWHEILFFHVTIFYTLQSNRLETRLRQQQKGSKKRRNQEMDFLSTVCRWGDSVSCRLGLLRLVRTSS